MKGTSLRWTPLLAAGAAIGATALGIWGADAIPLSLPAPDADGGCGTNVSTTADVVVFAGVAAVAAVAIAAAGLSVALRRTPLAVRAWSMAAAAGGALVSLPLVFQLADPSADCGALIYFPGAFAAGAALAASLIAMQHGASGAFAAGLLAGLPGAALDALAFGMRPGGQPQYFAWALAFIAAGALPGVIAAAIFRMTTTPSRPDVSRTTESSASSGR